MSRASAVSPGCLIGASVPYTPPPWVPTSLLQIVPKRRIVLAHTPTPIQPIRLPGLPESCPVLYIKRDDYTGSVEMSGNKTRKLEFLLADAIDRGCDCIITAGGTQSNHCRCAVACSRAIGLDTHLVLRDDFHDDGGNFFLDRLMGAKILQLDRETYTSGGGFVPFMDKMRLDLEKEGRKPYVIPVGGTSPLGTWGYIEMLHEFTSQQMVAVETALGGAPFSDIVCTTGSGSTLAGLAIGAKWFNESDAATKRPFPLSVRGYNVCDTPKFFYDMTSKLGEALYAPTTEAHIAPVISALEPSEKGAATSNSDSSKGEDELKLGDPKSYVEVRDARGLGYSKSTTEELQFLNEVARRTGIMFDRAYTNKALFGLVKDLASGSLQPKGKVLFVHTGGGASSFDQHDKIIKCIGHDTQPFTPLQ